ncbi:low molecular weight protein tyrosine phosphatase family protein [Methylobacterium sp. E-045]|uniref:low molecular weight protein tyrosine phosphatase family protein n=1 Tax=Methylobacterium sp. E-045 TaxID=2836575 RepID=UPI001FB878C3|nr:low molecular weight protein tyrosine phosphatase family protein [Methylobacterium sp. E-045]MCJ2129308.1 low molecular weight protein tyrosine phosphatase family protein [Methylobacterium sp. E-045]
MRRNLLFVCGRNRLRSPTAEQVFSGRSECEVASAGIDHDADEPVTAEWLEWADIVFVMERRHRTKLRHRYGAALKHARVICLDIPDDYGFMDPDLVRLLDKRVTPHLRG